MFTDLIVILSFACAALAAGIVFYTHKKRPKTPVHPCEVFHDYVVINSQLLKGDTVVTPQTVVLRRCSRCGMRIWQTYVGEWELIDFLKTDSDMSWLERAAK